MKNTIEQGQSTTPDFKALFNKRLAECPSLVSGASRVGKDLINDAQINGVKKLVDCIVFSASFSWSEDTIDQNWGLWLENFDSVEIHNYPHVDLELALKKHTKYSGLSANKIASAAILEDNDDKRCLLLGGIHLGMTRDTPSLRKKWTELAESYDIKTIVIDTGLIGDLGHERPLSGDVFINNDALGRKREDDYINRFAVKYEMINTQWLRFRSLANSANAAKIRINYDTLAKEVCSPSKE